jgi:hypothetical protein
VIEVAEATEETDTAPGAPEVMAEDLALVRLATSDALTTVTTVIVITAAPTKETDVIAEIHVVTGATSAVMTMATVVTTGGGTLRLGITVTTRGVARLCSSPPQFKSDRPSTLPSPLSRTKSE